MNKESKVKSAEDPITGSATYIETVYGTNNFAKSLMLDDAQSIMDLMDDFADQQTKPLQSHITKLEAKVAELESIIEFGDGMILQLKNETRNLEGENARLENKIVSLKMDMVEIKHVALDLEYAKSIAEQALKDKEAGDGNV